MSNCECNNSGFDKSAFLLNGLPVRVILSAVWLKEHYYHPA